MERVRRGWIIFTNDLFYTITTYCFLRHTLRISAIFTAAMHFQSSTDVVVGVRKLTTRNQLRLRGLKQPGYTIAVSDAIKAVEAISKDLVALPETIKYDEITYNYFSELERELRPACYLTPSSAEQVSDVVKAIKPFANGSRVAIAGAGQQATPGVSNVRDGLTVHLRNLKGIEIDTEKQVVSIAAGETMGDVYEKLVELGLGVQGNRHSRGGIGGDALQGKSSDPTKLHALTPLGGLSYFSYDRGFVCDDVVNYEVVLSNGEIVNANATTNPDLFSALKGGGNNFGIVTRFDMRVFKQHNMWGGKQFYFQPQFPEQIDSLVDYLQNPTDTNIHICLSMGYAAAFGDIVCTNDIFCTSPGMPKALEPFANMEDEMEVMNTLRVHDLKEFTDERFSDARANRSLYPLIFYIRLLTLARVVKMTTTVKANADILSHAVKTFRAAFDKVKGTKNLLYSLTFEPIPVSMIEASNAKGENAMGLKPSDGPLVVILLYTAWDDAADTEKILTVNKDALKTIEAEAKSKDVASPYRYLNYAFEQQAPYSKEAMQKLRATSQKYDPEGFFRDTVAGPIQL